MGSKLPAGLPASQGKVFYVSRSGSDRNRGTSARPWRTIGKAMRTLRPGQTALVLRGTYAESLQWSRGGTEAAPITIAAAPGARAVITGRVKILASYVRLAGFRIVGQTSLNSDEVAVYVTGGAHVEISRNEITRAARSGIFVSGAVQDLQVVGNRIHHNGTRADFDHGIYWHSGNGLIANNVIEGNIAYGIQLYANADGVVVTSNTIVGNGRSGIIVAGDSGTTSDGNLLVNNILAFNAEFGLRSYWAGSVGTGNIAQANLGYLNAEGDFATGAKGRGLELAGSLSGAPAFADPSASDYHLGASSSALDRGLSEYAPALDFEGNARPQGAAPDLGAFER